MTATPATILRACAICGGKATIVDEAAPFDSRSDEAWCHQHARPRPAAGMRRVYLADRRIASKGGFA